MRTTASIYSVLKLIMHRVAPSGAKDWRRRLALRRLRKKNAALDRQTVFTRVYEERLWGGEPGTFCSGRGSDGDIANEYCEMVRIFIHSHNIRTVLDIGCGDFRIGQRVQVPDVTYIGADIVPALIERNRRAFASARIEFQTLDAVKDYWPSADLVLIRQVLQHLSNQEIIGILRRLDAYPYAIVTEHCPSDDVLRVPNLDKPHGSDTRLSDNSGVYLAASPFNVIGIRTLLETPVIPPLLKPGEVLRSVLITKAICETLDPATQNECNH